LRKIIFDKRGIALILAYLLTALLVIILGVFMTMCIRAMNEAQIRQNWQRAFFAAESAIDDGLASLPAPPPPLPFTGSAANLGSPSNAQHRTSIDFFGGSTTKWRVNGIGFVPTAAATPRWEVEIEVIAEQVGLPNNFFDNALYSADDLSLRGNPTINGDVYYGDDLDKRGSVTITGDETTSPPPPANFSLNGDIDYNRLRDIANQQDLADPTYDHLITAADLASGVYTLPNSFWLGNPGDGVPNVVYVEGDLNINNQTIGGFIVVAGGIINGGSVDTDANIGGGSTINGCILSVDDLVVSGGGGHITNINGGAWAGNLYPEPRNPQDGLYINGSVTITYSQAYMNAVENLNFSSRVRVLSWQQLRREVR
jgi:hypothetical protein